MVAEMKTKGIAPNAMTYTALITGCAMSQRAHRARELLGEMAAAGLPPNVYTSTATITAFTKCGEWTSALQARTIP